MLDGVLDRKKLKHNPDAIRKLFSNKGDQIVANGDFYILFPERYINKGLAVMGSSVKLLAVYAVVDKSMNYGVVMAPTFMDIIPSNVTNVVIDGVVNKALEINKGNPFVLNRNLMKVDTFMYDLFDEFYLQGKVPWYIKYQDLAKIFSEASKYAGSNIGNDPLALEIITSLIARDPKDKRRAYREVMKSPDKGVVVDPAYVGLNNVFFSYDNTLAKVMGGFMQIGVTTTIVDKEETPTKVSRLLRA